MNFLKGLNWVCIIGILVAVEQQIASGTISLANSLPHDWIPAVKEWCGNLAMIGALIISYKTYGAGKVAVVPHGFDTSGNTNVSPSSGKFGAGNAVIAFFLLATALLLSFALPARAADVTQPAKAATFGQRFGVGADCTLTNCTGPYVGFNFAGVATNANLLGNGINGSLTAGGQNIGGQIGYQFWNGTYFFGPEIFADYTYGGSAVVGGFPSAKYLVGEVIKFGGPLSSFFGNITPANPTGISAVLTSHTISPYFVLGAAQRDWGTGLVAGAGITFQMDAHWFADARYMNIQYTSGNRQASPIQTVPQENIIMVGVNYKF